MLEGLLLYFDLESRARRLWPTDDAAELVAPMDLRWQVGLPGHEGVAHLCKYTRDALCAGFDSFPWQRALLRQGTIFAQGDKIADSELSGKAEQFAGIAIPEERTPGITSCAFKGDNDLCIDLQRPQLQNAGDDPHDTLVFSAMEPNSRCRTSLKLLAYCSSWLLSPS